MPARRTNSGLVCENRKLKAELESIHEELTGAIGDHEKLKAKHSNLKKAYQSESYFIIYTLFCRYYASPGKDRKSVV